MGRRGEERREGLREREREREWTEKGEYLRRVEKPTRVWPDTRTSGPTHGPGRRSPLLLAREQDRRVCVVYVCTHALAYARAHRRTPQDNTVRHTRDLCSFHWRDDDGGGGGDGVATMTSRCRHPTHAYAHPHTLYAASLLLLVHISFPET